MEKPKEERRILSVAEMEQQAQIPRTEARRPTRYDAEQLERKKLSSWGKPRRKLEGWPR